MKLLILTAFCGVFTAQAQAPCCRVTSVDAPARIATGEVTTGGGEFAFRVDDSKLLAGLKTGQAVWANFTAKRVSLDGRSACCAITRVGPAGAVRAPLLSSVAATRPIAAAGCRHAWLPQYGGVICKGSDPSRPVILLVHGLHQSVESWTKPSSTGYTYDFRHTPVDVDLGDHAAPNAGLYKAGASDKLDVDGLNWFDYLAGQGFTVAAWSQPCCTFAAAYPSAVQALAQFASDTATLNPAAPPPIVLLGHSRGGLVIHKLLRDQGTIGGRIRFAITIHSPHHGSLMAKTPERLADEASALFANVSLRPDAKQPLKQLALQMVAPLKSMIDDGQAELAPDSPVITGLLTGDTPIPGVRYYTFGGTNPTLFRLYTWLFTPMSSVPQYKGLEQYFQWRAKPVEVGLVSPLLDRIPAFNPEIKPGEGDSLVTDQSARLPYSIHQTDRLNHAEVLWDRGLQQNVVRILSATAPVRASR
ncbi:MAG: GPI inositol-deacylase [Acidobacteriia bacterium]|nr:GPI inositol-deacylase [Terriglobia bacterium]